MSVRLRLYCQGIGDCILVDMPRDDGGRFHLLVDCGAHHNTADGKEKMADVVENLIETTGGRFDAIAGTHEHWDHLSAFYTASARFRADDVRIDSVWMSWAEDPSDPVARKLDRFKGEATAAIAGMRLQMGVNGVNGPEALAVDSLMGFVMGLKGERVRNARESLRSLAPGGKATVLKPGTQAEMPGVSTVNAWVLGPPRDETTLKIHDNPADEYRLGMSSSGGIAALDGALAVLEGRKAVADDPTAPFDGEEGVAFSPMREGRWPADDAVSQFVWRHYFEHSDPKDDGFDTLAERRRIDGDWFGSALDFALQLDRNTNNSSLVLALEIGDGGPVLLLAADAQGGAWKSFKDVKFIRADGSSVTGEELMKRTVFYKVGHHGSVNATSVTALEKMDSDGLVAFVPVDTEAARVKCKWKDFPAHKVVMALQRLTQGRLIMADSSWVMDQREDIPFDTKLGTTLTGIERGKAGATEVPWVDLTFL